MPDKVTAKIPLPASPPTTAPIWSDCVVDLFHGDTVDTDSGFHDMITSGVAALVHKATQGNGPLDVAYIERRKRAAAVGMLWGSYHFAMPSDGAAQAEHYLALAAPIATDLVCLDWEDRRGPKGTDLPDMTRKDAEAFVSRIHEKLGRWPILYSGYSFLNERMAGVTSSPLRNCPLWIARYAPAVGPTPGGWKAITMWQWTEAAPIAGVINPGDRDRYRGTVADLKAKWPRL